MLKKDLLKERIELINKVEKLKEQSHLANRLNKSLGGITTSLKNIRRRVEKLERMLKNQVSMEQNHTKYFEGQINMLINKINGIEDFEQ